MPPNMTPEMREKISEGMKRAYAAGRHARRNKKKTPNAAVKGKGGLLQKIDAEIAELTRLRETLKQRGLV